MSVESRDARLSDLLLRWEELREQGEPASAESLCPDDTELAAELARRIAALREIDSLLVAPETVSLPPSEATGAPAPEAATARTRGSATCVSTYRDLRFHAEGGLGEVFLARGEDLQRDVALKFLKPPFEGDRNLGLRFLREAEVTGRLEHPGVVPVYAIGQDDRGRRCYAMRLIRGRTLNEAIREFHAARSPEGGASPWLHELPRLLRRFVSVCYTLAFAHSRGVVHRDIKPRNIMLGPFDETLVVDWGLAKVLGERTGRPDTDVPEGDDAREARPGNDAMAPTAGVAGTAQYMSPEQAEGRWDQVGPASDIYSLGASLYVLLTGKHPFRGRDFLEVRAQVRRGAFLAPRQVHPEVPRALEAICLKAMARAPEHRYPTALDLAADLERWLAGEPVSAWREPWPIRARRWLARHRTLVAAAAVGVVVAMAGLAAVAVIQVQSNRQLRAANQRETRAKQLAIDRFNLALEAIETYHTGASRDALLRQPEFQDLRTNLLQAPLGFYRKLTGLLETDETSDSTSRAELGRAYFDLANLSDTIGSKEDAGRAYERSLALREALAAADPGRFAFRRDLAATLSDLGLWQTAQGRHEAAGGSFDRAIALQAALRREQPADRALRAAIARSHADRAALYRKTGRTDAALRDIETARRIRSALVGEDPGTPRYREDLAQSYLNLGVHHAETGRPAQALDSYRRALAIQQELHQDLPGDVDVKYDLAMIHNNMGVLHKAIGQATEATHSYRAALALFSELVQARPAIIKFQNALAAGYNNLGLLLAASAPAEAIQAYRRALEIKERLARDHPSVTEYQNGLATTYLNLGFLQDAIGAHGQAVDAHRHAIALFETLARANPGVPKYRFYLGGTLTNLGDSQRAVHQPGEALGSYDRAIEVLSAFVHDHPREPSARNTLGTALGNRGLALESLGRRPEAEEWLRQGIEHERQALDQAPAVVVFRQALSDHDRALARIQQALGRNADALATIERRQALWPSQPAELYEVARELARGLPRTQSGAPGPVGPENLAFQQSCVERAIQALRQAVLAGFHDLDRVQADADLGPLRSRREFLELVRDMSFPRDPFAR
jgi:serine/threonine-protein kinase